MQLQMWNLQTTRGRSLPLGATELGDGVNFVLLCRHGTAVSLVLFSEVDNTETAEIPLDPDKHRTGDHWHIHVRGLPAVFRYGWRVDGPHDRLHRFDRRLILLDPTSTAVSDGAEWGQEPDVPLTDDPLSHGTRRRSLFVRNHFDWGEDRPPRIPLVDSIVYELHVRGFTVHPSSQVTRPGTFLGLTEKIPYLRQLGVTAVELLPVHEFDENNTPFTNPFTGEPLRDFWGYNPIAFSAPKAAYASEGARHQQVVEFREMVRRFHAAGIEVFLDVVFNHTGEGDDRGRTYSLRGLDNDLYYMLGPNGEYLNFSGCGNTINCNHPLVRELIVDCLRYWVSEMHVDGLRFDLASVFGRDRTGRVIAEPPIVEMIVEDGVLRDTKLIAEPWDAAGLYQVGRFPFGQRWAEWNGRYRDDVRRFWRGDAGMAGAFATRICGSADLYEPSGRPPCHSVNFVTCHDGFTLWDLVSYNRKHNLANGENNLDGADVNYSWNCGIEGPTGDEAVLSLRRRQVRNFFLTLMISQGVPMILGGDEFLRTQRGNNNAWCQDNEISWVDWTFADDHADFLRFARMAIALRRRHPVFRRRSFFTGSLAPGSTGPDIDWHGLEPHQPDWSRMSKFVACTLDGRQTGREYDTDFCLAFNANRFAVAFRIPPVPNGGQWRRLVDTSQSPPEDFLEEGAGEVLEVGQSYRIAGFASLVLIST